MSQIPFPTNSFQRTSTGTTDANVMQVFYDFINTDSTLWQVKTTTPVGDAGSFTAESAGAEVCEINFRIDGTDIKMALAAGGGITNPDTLAGGVNVREEIFVQSTGATFDSFHFHEWDDAMCMLQFEPPAATTGSDFPQGFMAGNLFWPYLATDNADGMPGYMMVMGTPGNQTASNAWVTTNATSKTYILAASGSDTWLSVEHGGIPTAVSGAIEVAGRIQPSPLTIQLNDNSRPLGVMKYLYYYWTPKNVGNKFENVTESQEMVFIGTTIGQMLLPIEFGFETTA
jgi:hypothetical protein